MFTYAYLIGGFILSVFWLLIFVLRSDLRKEILYGSFVALPFGFLESFTVPEYWDPPSVFNLIHTLGFGIESFIFAFFIGGIATVVFEFYGKKKLVKIRSGHKTHLLPYITFIALFLLLELLFPTKSIYSISIALLAGAGIIAIKRRDLLVQIIASGAFFAVTYMALFYLFTKIFPDYIASTYVLDNIWGVFVGELPIEEIIFAFSVGACWSTLYEYSQGYRTK